MKEINVGLGIKIKKIKLKVPIFENYIDDYEIKNLFTNKLKGGKK